MKYILFDLDGTLLDFTTGEKNAFSDTIKYFSNYLVNDNECDEFSKINEYYFNEYSKGNMDRKTFHYHRFDEIKKYLKLAFDPVKANEYYVNSLKYQAILYDDVIDILDYLSKKYLLFAASNGQTIVQVKRLETAGIDKYFKKYYISEDVGYNKPNEGFFNYIFNDLNDNKKDEYVIIGDRLDTDILGGINVGIKTIYLNRFYKSGSIKPDYEIKSLNELKKIL